MTHRVETGPSWELRLRKGYTAPLFSEAPARMEQTGLDLGGTP